MDTGTLVGLVGALGAGGIIAKLLDNVFAWFNGKTGKENNAWAQRDAAWEQVAKERARADHEAKNRRLLEEYNAVLRIEMKSHGIKPEDWPTYKTQQ